MTDLIEQLKAMTPVICKEAADEIERLSANNEQQKMLIEEAWQTEERLRAALEKYADPDWWPEQLQSHDYLRKLAREVLKDE